MESDMSAPAGQATPDAVPSPPPEDTPRPVIIAPLGTPPDAPPPPPEEDAALELDTPPVRENVPPVPPVQENIPPVQESVRPPQENAPPPQDDTHHPSLPPEGNQVLAPRPSSPPPSPPPADILPPVWTRPAVLPRVVSREKMRRRHKTSDAPKKPGKPSWVYGTKLVFFERYKDAFMLASEAKTTGDLYTKLAKLYTLKYGFELQDDEDFESDIEDPPDYMADVVESGLSTEDGLFQSDYRDKLRGVSKNSNCKEAKLTDYHQRIGAWFRGQYGTLTKETKTAFAKLFTGALAATPAKPQRGQLIHFYSRKFYDERVKARADSRYHALKRRAELAGEAPPSSIKVSNMVTVDCWDEETPAFQAEVKVACEVEYQKALKAWEASLADSPNKTPEELDACLHNAAHYLRPFIDAIQERFGMCVSILLCGPIGSRGGSVGVQSIHAGRTKAFVEQDWPECDPQGFSAAEASMISFAKEHFSEADCRARAVGISAWATTEEGDTLSGVPRTNLTAQGRTKAVAPAQPPKGPATAPAAPAADGDGGPGPVGNEGPSFDDDDMSLGPVGNEGPSFDDNAWMSIGGNGGGGNGEGGDGNGGGGQNPEESEEAAELRKKVDEMWHRDDRAEWTQELVNAHAGFERGKSWGPAWAACVSQFFDFEAAHRYADDGAQIGGKGRPKPVKAWIGRARKWNVQVDLGRRGSRELLGSYIGMWWGWWVAMQPEERIMTDGELSKPTEADWGPMSKLYGKNGLLQVMATLLWWGDSVDWDDDVEDVEERVEWEQAVNDVAWVLEELQRPDVLGNHAKGNRKRAAEDGPQRTRKKAKTISGDGDGDGDGDDDGSQRRTKKKKTTGGDDEGGRRTRVKQQEKCGVEERGQGTRDSDERMKGNGTWPFWAPYVIT
ncbi:hypothetical protein C8R44DRAFT_740117 [Mycena epipterygia]|nr:hypothetical protein C8R44DRAFT_740117 [Mycena epipterygia]